VFYVLLPPMLTLVANACQNATGTGLVEERSVVCDTAIAAVTPQEADAPTPVPVPPADNALTDVGPDDACTVAAINTVNQRSGPGTNYPLQGQLGAGQVANPDGYAEGADGFRWWRLDSGAWLRSDLVDVAGNCAVVDAVEVAEVIDPPAPAPESGSPLQTLRMISISSLSESTRYTAEITGTYRFQIVSGAIQNCPPGADPTNPNCSTWTAHVLLYVNRGIIWSPSPTAWDYQLGDSSPVGTAAEAIARSLGAFVDISLAAGDYVIIVASDSQGDYVDNLGELTLSVSLVGAGS